MVEIDPITGLPKELGTWDSITKESQEIIVTTEKRKFGKIYTIVKGFDKEIELNNICKKLKAKLACGGTAKDGQIELQGKHLTRTKEILGDLGFAPDSIVMK